MEQYEVGFLHGNIKGSKMNAKKFDKDFGIRKLLQMINQRTSKTTR